MTDETIAVDWDSLVGKFFHLIGDDGYAHRQGHVLSEPYPQVFAVQYFEWLMGQTSSGVSLVRLDGILDGDWRFYSTDEAMRDAYEHGGLQRPSSRDPG